VANKIKRINRTPTNGKNLPINWQEVIAVKYTPVCIVVIL